jgi:DNA-directed RNA polymerase subunit beta'
MKNLKSLRDLDALQIKLASPEDILEWSYGEVTKPETINYRSFKPEPDGLFCQRIFGPVNDYECACGKYKRIRYKGVVCDRCGVEVTYSKVRRERMGHIVLSTPVVHVWFFKNIPSVLAALLNIPPRSLELVIYFSSFIVTDIDHEAKKKLIETFEDRINTARVSAKQIIEKQADDIVADAELKIQSLSKEPEKKWAEDLQKKAADIRKKASDKAAEILSREGLEMDKAEFEIKKIEKKLNEVELHTVMTDKEYISLEEYLDEFCEVGIGAEAIRQILEELDIKKLRDQLREDVETVKSAKSEKLLKRLKIAESFIKGEVDPKSIVIEVLPVIPPDLRPMVMLEGGRFATSDLNDLYRRIINRNNRLKKLLDLGAPNIIVRNEKRMLQESVDALFDSSKVRASVSRDRKTYRSIADAIKGKQGHFRANLLGKRVDYSGRAVIVSGPSLKMHECGLPTDMAFELYRPFLLREIMKRGLAPNMKTAKYILEERSDEIYNILEELVVGRPVLLNRAPTLHKLSMQAFYPKLTDNKAIQLHPVVCAGFNADFDGDQMAIHLPLSDEAVAEADALMLSTRNMLKPADGSVQTNVSHEIILGLYYLTSVNETYSLYKGIFSSSDELLKAYGNKVIDLRQLAKVQINGEIIETTAGRVLINKIIPQELGYVNYPLSKSKASGLIKQALNKVSKDEVVKLVDDFKEFGFKYSTDSGISLSIFDCIEPKDMKEIMEKAKNDISSIEQNYHMGLITEPELKKLSQKIWMSAAEYFDKTILNDIDKENPVSIVISASAGKASATQMRQISAFKGLVTDPKGALIDIPILGNYAGGMSNFDYFLTARAVRKTYMDKGLGTADAGYLTRRLVNVAQDVLVREDDCGATEGRTVVRGDNTTLMQWYDRIVGRYALEDVKAGNKVLVKAGELITKEISEKIGAEEKVTHVSLRSPLKCQTPYGVCAKCYGVDLSTSDIVEIGMAVGIIAAQSIGEPGTQLTMKTFHSGGIAGDNITQGLPRVEEIFELRKPKRPALMSAVAGKVEVVEEGTERKIIVKPTDKKLEEVIYTVENTDEVVVSTGDLVAEGTKLTAGSMNLQDLYAVAGPTAAQKYVIDEVQKVYGAQGVMINDKHLEVIVKQMFNRVKIFKSYGTDLLPGDIVTKYRLDRYNRKAKKDGLPLYESEPIVVGISKASRLSESWLDAASFEETAAVLTESAIGGTVDELIGLKENVIIGRRIPVGKSAEVHRIIKDSE